MSFLARACFLAPCHQLGHHTADDSPTARVPVHARVQPPADACACARIALLRWTHSLLFLFVVVLTSSASVVHFVWRGAAMGAAGGVNVNMACTADLGLPKSSCFVNQRVWASLDSSLVL